VSLVSTTRRAKFVVLMIVLAGFSLGSYPLWTIGVKPGEKSKKLKCLIEDKTAYKHWNTVILMFGTLIIPGIIIAVITSVIVAILSRAARRRESLQTDGQVLVLRLPWISSYDIHGYTLSQKVVHQTHGDKFVSCERIFKILLLLEIEVNFQQKKTYNTFYHTFSILPHYLAKFRSSNLW